MRYLRKESGVMVEYSGVSLGAPHWYTAGATADELENYKNAEVAK